MKITDEMVVAAAKRIQPTAGNHASNCTTFYGRSLMECICDVKALTLTRARAALEAALEAAPRDPLAFCTKTQNCRLTDGHEGGCVRS